MKRIIIVLTAFLMSLSLVALPVMAQENEEISLENMDEESYVIDIEYDSPTVQEHRHWLFEYNDNWFKNDARIYNHKLARLSLGLTFASFRPLYNKESYSEMSANLIKMFNDAGFTNLRSDDYDKNPSLYTISTGIASKKLTDSKGEFYLIAIGVCGSGYGNEWSSNFTIGNEEQHVGFTAAAQEIYDRIFGYMATNNLFGKRVKAWISGFSRAAAVSNLVAKMLDDSDVFDESNVFAYTFATPRNTRNPKKNQYQNIFNITGKMDPVPQVPFADWGFDRYGVTLYTPSQQTDTNYNILFKKANKIFKELTGIEFWNNVEWDTKLRVILNYLLKIAPDVNVYVDHIQDRLINIVENKTVSNAMTQLFEMASEEGFINENNEEEANAFMTYVAYTLYGFTTRSDIDAKYRSENATLKSNLALEHVYDVYLAWMFSTDDPNELFQEHLYYSRFVVEGKIDVAVISLFGVDEPKLVKGINADGSPMQSYKLSESEIHPMENGPDIFMERKNNETIILLPRDDAYLLSFHTPTKQEVSINAIMLKVGYTNTEDSSFISKEMEADDYIAIFSMPDEWLSSEESFIIGEGDTFDDVEISRGSDQEWAINLQRMNVLNLNWRQLIILVYTIPIILFTVLAFLITWAIKKHRLNTKKRLGLEPESARVDNTTSNCAILSIALFMIQELLYWLMPKFMIYRSIIKLVIGLLLTYVAFRNYRRQPTRLSLFVLISMGVMILADIMINYNFSMGMYVFTVAELILLIVFYRHDRPDRWQYIVWVLLSIVSAVTIYIFGKGVFNNLVYSMVIYCCILSGLLAISLTMPKKVRYAVFFLIVANIMIFINEVSGRTLLGHIVALGTYYTAVIIFALSTRFVEKPVINRVKEA